MENVKVWQQSQKININRDWRRVRWTDVEGRPNIDLKFDPETILGDGTSADPYSVDLTIDYYIGDFSSAIGILPEMLYKVVRFNDVAAIDVELVNMEVGDWFEGLILGAGLPNIIVGANQTLLNPSFDFTGVKNFIIRRLENDGATEIYEII